MLEFLRAGKSIRKSAEAVGISNATYYNWRRKSEEFCQLADDSIKYGENAIQSIKEFGTPLKICSSEEQNAFLETYWLTGSKMQASEKSGIDARTVFESCDENSPEYDETFASEVKKIFAYHLIKIEDKYIDDCLNGNDAVSRRWALEKLVERYAKPSTKMEVKQVHTFELNPVQQDRLLIDFIEGNILDEPDDGTGSEADSDTA